MDERIIESYIPEEIKTVIVTAKVGVEHGKPTAVWIDKSMPAYVLPKGEDNWIKLVYQGK